MLFYIIKSILKSIQLSYILQSEYSLKINLSNSIQSGDFYYLIYHKYILLEWIEFFKFFFILVTFQLLIFVKLKCHYK